MTASWTRRVVPLWVRSAEPPIRFVRLRTRPHHQLSPLQDSERGELAQVLADFEEEPTIGVAADALRFAFHPEVTPKLKSIAKFILEQADVPSGLMRLANAVDEESVELVTLHGKSESDKSHQFEIHDVRRWLVRHPHDALSWLDLGRLHAGLGNTAAARRAVQTAYALSPDSRTILRGASRFYLHARDPERALQVLDRSSRTANDPWLLAGHIAISSILGRTSKHSKRAKKLVGAGLAPGEATELASSLATVELEAGAVRAAKKLFNQALQDPNENSLAQAEWAVHQLNVEPTLPLEWFDNPASAEASYYRDLSNSDFQSALLDAVRWHRDEPFASRPMIGASFIASVTGRLDEASAFARQGLVTEPDNLELLNNLAFSVGSSGNIDAAERIIRKIVALERRDLSGHTLANLGMISYLRGESELADQLYERAIRHYKRQRQLEQAAIAAIFKALFARRTAVSNAESATKMAQGVTEESKSSLAGAVFRMLLGVDMDDPSGPRKVVGPRRWHYDPEKNVLTFERFTPLG